MFGCFGNHAYYIVHGEVLSGSAQRGVMKGQGIT